MHTTPIVVEQILNAPAERIWQALTQPQQMKQWYFDLPGFKAEQGYAFEFMGGPSPEKQYRHLCVITDVHPLQSIAYTWRYDGYEGHSIVTFSLTAQENKTLVRLSHSGVETFPADNPDLAKENFIDGWNSIIKNSLTNYIEANKE